MDFVQNLQQLRQQNLYRQTFIANTNLINFCSNDYLSLKNHPQLIATFKQGVDKYGVGTGSSHLISGHSSAHQQLEEYLADFTKQEKTLLFSTGYMANLGIFSALKNDLNWVLQDKLNHASIIDGVTLIQQKIRRYKHNNIASLLQKVSKLEGSGLIATDTVFSMDGDIADINQLNKVANDNQAILMQDDAHGFGIYNTNIPTHSIYMATFGKALGTSGAFVAGSADFIDYLQQKSRPYIYTTALPSALAIATIQSLEIVKTGERQQQLLHNVKLFKQQIKTNSNTAIQPIIIGDNDKALNLSQYLLKNGFWVVAIRPPTVKKAILRITINAGHTEQQITRLTTLLNAKL